eukprot:4023585-Amphidinium_carterae.1
MSIASHVDHLDAIPAVDASVLGAQFQICACYLLAFDHDLASRGSLHPWRSWKGCTWRVPCVLGRFRLGLTIGGMGFDEYFT